MSVSYDYPILCVHWLSIYSQKCHFPYLLFTSPMPSHQWPSHLSCTSRWHNPGMWPRQPQGPPPCRQGVPSMICATFPSLILLPQAWRLSSSKVVPYPGAPKKNLTGPSYLPWAQLLLARKVGRSNECTVKYKDQDPTSSPKCISILLWFYTGQAYLYSSLIGHKILPIPFFSWFWQQLCEVGHVLISHFTD